MYIKSDKTLKELLDEVKYDEEMWYTYTTDGYTVRIEIDYNLMGAVREDTEYVWNIYVQDEDGNDIINVWNIETQNEFYDAIDYIINELNL